MTYFFTPILPLSISAIVADTATQIMTSIEQDVNIFNNSTLNNISSNIGYPSITISSNIINLEQGWKFIMEIRPKVTSPNLSLTEYLRYIVTDTNDNLLSSIGNMNLLRTTNASTGQEKCLTYIDTTNSPKSIKVRANVINNGGNVTLNGQDGTDGSTFKSYILIKAYKDIPTNYFYTSSSLLNSLTSISQLTSSSLNKYHQYTLSNSGYRYFPPASPTIGDAIGFIHTSGSGNFAIEYPANSGTYLTGDFINSSSVRKSFVFQWDGTTWVDIGQFTLV
jgi:hypothetical protein